MGLACGLYGDSQLSEIRLSSRGLRQISITAAAFLSASVFYPTCLRQPSRSSSGNRPGRQESDPKDPARPTEPQRLNPLNHPSATILAAPLLPVPASSPVVREHTAHWTNIIEQLDAFTPSIKGPSSSSASGTMPASTGKSVNGQQAAAIAAGQGYGDQGAMAALSAASSNAYDPGALVFGSPNRCWTNSRSRFAALSSSSLPSVFAQHPSVQLPPIRYPPPGANLSLAPLLQAASAADFDASKNLFAQPAFQNSSVYGGGAEDVAVKEKRTGASGSGERKSEEKEEEGEEVNAEEGSARQLKNTSESLLSVLDSAFSVRTVRTRVALPSTREDAPPSYQSRLTYVLLTPLLRRARRSEPCRPASFP